MERRRPAAINNTVKKGGRMPPLHTVRKGQSGSHSDGSRREGAQGVGVRRVQ